MSKNRDISKMPLNDVLEIEVFDVWEVDFMGPFSSSYGTRYILLVVDYVSKWAEAIASPSIDAHLVSKFLKK